MKAVVVLTTAPDAKTGRKLARFLLEKKLAACVSQKDGFVSRYHWKGKLETAKESLLIVKGAAKDLSRIEKAIESVHPYEVPEILALPVSGASKKYLAWIETSLRK